MARNIVIVALIFVVIVVVVIVSVVIIVSQSFNYTSCRADFGATIVVVRSLLILLLLLHVAVVVDDVGGSFQISYGGAYLWPTPPPLWLFPSFICSICPFSSGFLHQHPPTHSRAMSTTLLFYTAWHFLSLDQDLSTLTETIYLFAIFSCNV